MATYRFKLSSKAFINKLNIITISFIIDYKFNYNSWIGNTTTTTTTPV